MIEYSIENIMASTNLDVKLVLKDVAEKLGNCEYNPDNFPGVIWRPKNSYGVVIIMDDGRMMCTNTRSIEEVEKIFEDLTKKMEERGLVIPRSTCPKCGSVVDAEDIVCVNCGNLLQE